VKTFAVMIPILCLLALGLISLRAHFSMGKNWLMALASGFLGSGILTGILLFVLHMLRQPHNKIMSGVGKASAVAFMAVFVGFVLHHIFHRLGELKSAVDSKARIDDLSKVATKILAGDENYFQTIVVPSKSGQWRDYARHSQTFPRVRRARPHRTPWI
jgi:hypothetical protein